MGAYCLICSRQIVFELVLTMSNKINMNVNAKHSSYLKGLRVSLLFGQTLVAKKHRFNLSPNNMAQHRKEQKSFCSTRIKKVTNQGILWVH